MLRGRSASGLIGQPIFWVLIILFILVPCASSLVLAISPRLFAQGTQWFTLTYLRQAFTGATAIAITNSSGQQVYGTTLTSTAGNNTWSWNGQNNAGTQLPDGAYNAAVVSANSNGTTSPLPFTVTGTATGVESLSSGMQLELGALTVPFSSVQSVAN